MNVITMRTRWTCRVPLGAIFVPELGSDGKPLQHGTLVASHEELEKLAPPVWFVYGLNGWNEMRRTDEETKEKETA